MKRNIYDDDEEPMTFKQKIVVFGLMLIVLCGVFLFIQQEINKPDYITEVKITYHNDKTETLYYKGQQEFSLNEGDLSIDGHKTFRSYVKSYTFKYHEKPKKDAKK